MHRGWLQDLNNLSTRSAIANIPSLQCPLRSGRQGGAFQKQEEPPKVEAQQQSWLAFHANRP